MEQFLKIGERYVQWVALALGLGWLGLMAFLYVAQPPSTVELEPGHPLLPGEVDLHMEGGRLKDIIRGIDENKRNIVHGVVNPAGELQGQIIGTQVERVKSGGGDEPKLPTTGPTTGPTSRPILAVVPAPQVAPGDPAAGTSILNVPPPAAAAPAAPAAGAAGAAGAAAVANGAPATPVLTPEDRDWIRNGWIVKPEDFDKAFKAANVPDDPDRYKVLFLRVELTRQEVSPSGAPVGKPVVVRPMSATESELRPMPDETASRDDKYAYLEWAAQNQPLILQPPFPTITAGTPDYLPGTPKPQDVFSAAAPAAAPVLAPVAPPPLAPPLPIRGGRPGRLGAPYGGPNIPGVRPGMMPVPGPYGPARRPYNPAATPSAVPPSAPGELALPQGDGAAGGGGIPGGFDPSQPQPTELTILTNDWTVLAGKTYQYRLRYWIANPLYLSQQAAKDVVDKWSIGSPYSEWSKAVSIPSRFEFFAQQLQRTTPPSVTFDVFTKKPDAPGGVTKDAPRLTPGDPIGNSGWDLVDIRLDPAKRQQTYYFLVSDAAGHVERRDLESDKTNQRHLDLNDRTGGTAPAGAVPVVPGAPGVAP